MSEELYCTEISLYIDIFACFFIDFFAPELLFLKPLHLKFLIF